MRGIYHLSSIPLLSDHTPYQYCSQPVSPYRFLHLLTHTRSHLDQISTYNSMTLRFSRCRRFSLSFLSLPVHCLTQMLQVEAPLLRPQKQPSYPLSMPICCATIRRSRLSLIGSTAPEPQQVYWQPSRPRSASMSRQTMWQSCDKIRA